MAKSDDGGPAFPQVNEQRYNDPVHGVISPKDIYGDAPSGMSLRDWFAGQALTAMSKLLPEVWNEHDVAKIAYVIADAMLKARQ
jgi:hypothetical protein